MLNAVFPAESVARRGLCRPRAARPQTRSHTKFAGNNLQSKTYAPWLTPYGASTIRTKVVILSEAPRKAAARPRAGILRPIGLSPARERRRRSDKTASAPTVSERLEKKRDKTPKLTPIARGRAARESHSDCYWHMAGCDLSPGWVSSDLN